MFYVIECKKLRGQYDSYECNGTNNSIFGQSVSVC